MPRSNTGLERRRVMLPSALVVTVKKSPCAKCSSLINSFGTMKPLEFPIFFSSTCIFSLRCTFRITQCCTECKTLGIRASADTREHQYSADDHHREDERNEDHEHQCGTQHRTQRVPEPDMGDEQDQQNEKQEAHGTL